MKSIFNKKKRIIDPYYLVAPPTRPVPPQGLDGGGTEVGMDGWMDGWTDIIKGEIRSHSIICRNMLA